ncbi:EF-P beta-lysylation protein EpmB [Wigglesworthia glossinidia]|nr:EF-P beta-lysylation protein EpmB [Wigglesworthia glossinidia]
MRHIFYIQVKKINIVLNKKKLIFNNLWLKELSDSITDPLDLLKYLGLDHKQHLLDGIQASKLFSFRVPKFFADLMEKGNEKDPLFLQVFTRYEEIIKFPKFVKDPLQEQNNQHDNYGFIKKYKNRLLILLTGYCVINCRYCFRRHFPYSKHALNQSRWDIIYQYIKKNKNINEIILSGGDPLMEKDKSLDKIITNLENISHLTTLRIHTRMLTLLPNRITQFLCERLISCSLNTVLVTHINHHHEISEKFKKKIKFLHHSKVILLNQSVLLRKVNDNALTLFKLHQALFKIGIIPYYLHMLDNVLGAAHFHVSECKAKKIMIKLLEISSGYLVPKFVKEVPGKKSKVLINLEF